MTVNYVPFLTTEVVDAAALNLRFESLDDAIEAIKDGTATLSGPAITSFANAQHYHEDAAGGGRLTVDAINSGAALSGQVPIADGAGNVAWGFLGQVPTGAFFPFAGAAAPTGYLLCDGQAVSRTTYAALFAVIGVTWGAGNGTTTFNVPDLRGAVPAGLDNMGGSSANRITDAQADSVAGSMGAETHTLTESEMPVHSHRERAANPAATNQARDLYMRTGSGGSNPGLVDNVQTTSTAELFTGTTGGGSAHNNVQPTRFTNYIIKT